MGVSGVSLSSVAVAGRAGCVCVRRGKGKGWAWGQSVYGAYVCSAWYACMRVLSLVSAGGQVEAAAEKVTAAEYEQQVVIAVNLLRCLVRLLPCIFFFFFYLSKFISACCQCCWLFCDRLYCKGLHCSPSLAMGGAAWSASPPTVEDARAAQSVQRPAPPSSHQVCRGPGSWLRRLLTATSDREATTDKNRQTGRQADRQTAKQ